MKNAIFQHESVCGACEKLSQPAPRNASAADVDASALLQCGRCPAAYHYTCAGYYDRAGAITSSECVLQIMSVVYKSRSQAEHTPLSQSLRICGTNAFFGLVLALSSQVCRHAHGEVVSAWLPCRWPSAFRDLAVLEVR